MEGRKSSLQHFEASVDAPIGKKYFYNVVKRVSALIILECTFELKFSDPQFLATCFCLYDAFCRSGQLLIVKRPDGSKRCVVRAKITIGSEFPTFLIPSSPHNIKGDHQIHLSKKDCLRGTLEYNFLYTFEENKKYKSYELQTVKGLYLLEKANMDKVKSIMKELIPLRDEMAKFDLGEVLSRVKLSSKSPIIGSVHLKGLSAWTGIPEHEEKKETTLVKYVNSMKGKMLYKGKLS